MKIKPKELDIPSENPFANDALDRKKNIETLTQFVINSDESFVMAINSPWGTGKTIFVQMWQKYLEQKQITTIYFNAWENDFCKDPLIPLIMEFITAMF